jgi:hypothetical protein
MWGGWKEKNHAKQLMGANKEKSFFPEYLSLAGCMRLVERNEGKTAVERKGQIDGCLNSHS